MGYNARSKLWNTVLEYKEQGLTYSADGLTYELYDGKIICSVQKGSEYPKNIKAAYGTDIVTDFYAENAESVQLPDTVTKITDNAFSDMHCLKFIRFSSELTEIGDYAFAGCVSLTTADLRNSKVRMITEGTFQDCATLRKVYLPDTVRRVSRCAFRNCPSLTSVYFPVGMHISAFAFSDESETDTPKRAILKFE